MSIDVQPTAAESQAGTPAAPANPTRRPTHQQSPPPDSEASGSRWVRGVIAALVIAGLGTAATFISGANDSEDSGPKLTHTIARRDLKVAVTEKGTLESANNIEVRCKVKGASSTIVSIIENGTEVKPGDILVQLDTSTIEDNINRQEIAYQSALSTFVQAESDVAVARITITEYEDGTFVQNMKTLEKDLAIAESNVRTARNMFEHAERMFKRGYISKLEVEGNEFTVKQSDLELQLKKSEIDVLERFTKAKMLEELKATLKSKEAKLESDRAALELEKVKLDREKEQLENCVIRSTGSGMAIYGGSEKWEDRPDIREGATVRWDQVLLLIPDLDNMQVKVEVHEAKIDRVNPGLPAHVTLQDRTYMGEVETVASMAGRAGWWNGNMVKYQTVIKIDAQAGLKPGMSADVEVFLGQYENVLTIPVGAVVEQDGQFYCWVTTTTGTTRRELTLGDTDDQFIIVEAGIKEGDEVVLNPLANVEEEEAEALQPFSGFKSDKAAPASKDGKPAEGSKEEKPAAQGAKPTGAKKESSAAQVMKALDKDGDGVLTKDEYADEHKEHFDGTDTNGDGKVDETELTTALKAAKK